MKKINSNKFNFSFFLSNRKEVKDLESGAIENGGATKIKNKIYSNIEGDEYIIINKTNTLAIYIPDTININLKTNNKKYVRYSVDYIKKMYDTEVINSELSEGSWYSEELKKVVYDNITIISIKLNTITEKDINNFIALAKYIKFEMKQEGVSININNALAIV
jgi:hypothetical protein